MDPEPPPFLVHTPHGAHNWEQTLLVMLGVLLAMLPQLRGVETEVRFHAPPKLSGSLLRRLHWRQQHRRFWSLSMYNQLNPCPPSRATSINTMRQPRKPSLPACDPFSILARHVFLACVLRGFLHFLHDFAC